MRKLFSLLASFVLLAAHPALAQPTVKEAPVGFDQPNAGITTGKLDSVSYPFTTVGTLQKALVYTSPGYCKNKKYPSKWGPSRRQINPLERYLFSAKQDLIQFSLTNLRVTWPSAEVTSSW
jgi:hypothetical protein